MAPPQTAKSERERKLTSLLAFSSKLLTRCKSTPDIASVKDLQKHVTGLPLQKSSVYATKQDELDRLGTELWNATTRLRRDTSKEEQKKENMEEHARFHCYLRMFSLLLLDSASNQAGREGTRKTCVRLMKVALKTARTCVSSDELVLATKALERAADYESILCTGQDDESTEMVALGDRLRMEYFILRIMLAWRQDRMDMAEHLFLKSRKLTVVAPPSTAESFADTLYEIGKCFVQKMSYEIGVVWLERAHGIIEEQELEMLSPEAGHLRLGIMQNLIQAYMKSSQGEGQTKAWHVLKLLEADHGEKMVVSLLKLELLYSAEAVETNQIHTVLHRMIYSIVLNERNFATIMHHVHKLKDHSDTAACGVLVDLLETRLFRDEYQAWIERAVVTYIWIKVTGAEEKMIGDTQELLDKVLMHTKDIFSAPATHAAQTLLWKRVEALHSQGNHATAEAWCRICLHQLFDKAGEQNKSRISRKLITCALARQDYASARSTFSKMSETGRDTPKTRYLMYKIALHEGETEFAAECLDLVCRGLHTDATFLQGCIVESLSAGDRHQTIAALGKVLEKYDGNVPNDIHLPALLRLTAKLLHLELTKDSKLNVDILEQLCTVFEAAYNHAKASKQHPSNQTQQNFGLSEYKWFAKNTYNLSLKYCSEMHPTTLTKLLKTCIEHENELDPDPDMDLRLRVCHFLAVCAFSALARAEDNQQNCQRYYLDVLDNCQYFRALAADSILKLDGSGQKDAVTKHYQIVKLELEATAKLRKWEAFGLLFEQAVKYTVPDNLESLADLTLAILEEEKKNGTDDKCRDVLISFLQRIINWVRKECHDDMTKLARWMRCLFQHAYPYYEKICLECIETATQIAAGNSDKVSNHDASALHTPPPSSPYKIAEIDPHLDSTNDEKTMDRYPPEEIEWLAAFGFNHAIDCYLGGTDEKCKLWAEKAINLAQWADDKHQLRDLLMGRFSELAWHDE
ncbi:SPO22-domain-containing protein [Corynespora cassiicola Philippines]|uniref:Protein ZIP4 homolog n=1 Tax=Corynespora cassiicola Philippines TaxID=1448308 RepID=A0A2T2NUA1_CORCC|nr:SPO22-domain-containing protein [Corynespora cassiicola Philippines]